MAKETKRQALGRGLGALIPTKDTPAAAPGPDTTAPVAAIRPNPWQPRTTFADGPLRELADSIRQRGILQPLVVRRVGDGYELISGERRHRAAQLAGLDRVPIRIHTASDSEMLEIALIENVQREDLNPIEEARAYRRMQEELSLTQEEIAAKVGKDRSTVANALRLLQLSAKIQGDVEAGRLSAGHARSLAGIASPQVQGEIAARIKAGGLSVREAEKLAKDVSKQQPDVERRAAEDRLMKALGTKVTLQVRRGGKGKLAIEFYSLEQLNDLIDRLAKNHA